MKWWITSLLFLLPAIAPPLAASLAAAPTSHLAADTVRTADTAVMALDTVAVHPSFYARQMARYRRDWSRIIPNQTTVQFAGNIGAYAFGPGWHYGRHDNWESELLLGYVPRSNGSPHHYTLTFKQRYIPWHLPLSRSQLWVAEPLTAGLFSNLIFGEGFWRHPPSKYTKGYYGFNTKLRYHIFIGQRLRYNIPNRHRKFNKSVTFYYELSASDLALVSAIPNRQVGITDILSLALGIRLEIF